jgi:hypothetical protein
MIVNQMMMLKWTVSALVQEQHDKYAEQERALRERGYAFLADYLRGARFRLDDVQSMISLAEEPSAIVEAHRQSLVVVGDSYEFMASQMEFVAASGGPYKQLHKDHQCYKAELGLGNGGAACPT